MSKQKLSNKKNLAIGYSAVAISFVLFVLSIIPNFATTKFFLGLFGILWYPILIFTALFGVAKIMNLSYSYNKKFTAYLGLFLASTLVLLHIIFSTPALSATSFGGYLASAYNLSDGVSVGGAVLAIVARCIYSIFGMVGSYCVPIILLTIFGGLSLDAIIYGNTKKKKIATNGEAQTLATNVINEKLAETDFEQEKPEEEFSPAIEPNIKPIYTEKQTPDDFYQKPTTPTRERDNNYKSAREILFGKRDIPDVTMSNDSERDQWLKNYRDNNPREASVADSSNNDIEELFGGDSTSSRAINRVANARPARSEIYQRNFPEDTSNFGANFGNLSNDDDDNDDIDISSSRSFGRRDATDRFSFDDNDNDQDNNQDNEEEDNSITPIVSRTSRFERPTRATGNLSKLGEDEVDQTRSSKKLDVKNKSYSGKQIGIKSVRYNSIPLSVFKVYTESNTDYSEEYRRKSVALEKVMSDFNIGAKVINVVRGPKVTRYELTLPDGVSVSRVLSIETDISMSIEAKSKIRIEAPIPGKKAFGIELENDEPSTVGMRELLESPEFINCKDPLPIAIGKDINGHVIIKSLPKMIHLLVAGSSGSGKSIFIHSLMMSILYKYSPDDVRFIMIDPKRVEFSMYNHLPHLMLPNVVSDHDKALNAIKWAVAEMDRRYVALQEHECQNLEQFNKLPEVTSGQEAKMPYLIIVVDELAELMGGSLKKDFEAGIQRITQLGRAAGIHMVVATQRPSVDVVTGTIKNNMPTRVAFALASSADSKTVLDEGGAENLLGKGDMLFAPQDMNRKIRLQAAFCDNDEIRNAIKYVKENNEATYDENAVSAINAEKPAESAGGQEGGAGAGGDDTDEYLKLAVQFAMSTGKVSVSLLQRKFRIGFNRASRLMDTLVNLGAVGPSVGSKPRDFIMTEEQYHELFGDDEE